MWRHEDIWTYIYAQYWIHIASMISSHRSIWWYGRLALNSMLCCCLGTHMRTSAGQQASDLRYYGVHHLALRYEMKCEIVIPFVKRVDKTRAICMHSHLFRTEVNPTTTRDIDDSPGLSSMHLNLAVHAHSACVIRPYAPKRIQTHTMYLCMHVIYIYYMNVKRPCSQRVLCATY